MLRLGCTLTKWVRLMALVVTPLCVFEGTASAQVSVSSIAATSPGSAELPEPSSREAISARSLRETDPGRWVPSSAPPWELGPAGSWAPYSSREADDTPRH
jgi:hypothetical protein